MRSPRDADLRRLRIRRLEAGRRFHTAYPRRHWPELFNRSNRGDCRFSPLEPSGVPVPTLYGADTQTVALLETVFHDVHAGGVRQISESLHLARRGLVALIAPRPLPLVDLTDDALKHLGVERRELVATAPSHYACTREWAAALHARRIGRIEPVGLVWRSRVAELAEEDALVLRDLLPRGSDVFMLFGDRLPTEPDAWSPGEPHFGDLASGEGRILAEEIATHLNAVIVSN